MKRFIGLFAGLVLSLGVAATPAHAGLFFYPGERNQVLYNNYENLYDAKGDVKAPLAAPVVGDHLAGIFQVNRINDLTGGNGSNIPDVVTFTGVFAQKIVAVVPIPLGFAILLDNPTIFTFNAGGDSFTLSDLAATGDMFAVYADPVAGGTPFTFQGLLAANVAAATDSTLLLTAKIDVANDSDNIATASVAFLPSPLPPVEGVSTATLSINVNNTGLTFNQIAPITYTCNPGATGQLVLQSRFTLNTDPLSKWGFTSFDPSEVQPTSAIPEPTSMMLMGLGLMGLAGGSKRRKLSA